MQKVSKFLMVSATLFLTILAFTFNPVMATQTDNTAIAEQIIQLIPDTLNLDIDEIEYEKAEESIRNNIMNLCKENGIDIDNLEEQGIYFEISSSLLYSKETFHQAMIEIDYNGTSLAGKSVNLSYKNHADYNANDEQYVKGLELSSPEYFEISLENSRIN